MKIILVLLLLVVGIFSASIDKLVVEQLQKTGSANIGIELRDQVDLQKYRNLEVHVDTKAEMIIKDLVELAERSQKPIKDYIKKINPSLIVSSVWISNTIFVKNVPKQIVYQLASRNDILQIVSNEEGDGLLEPKEEAKFVRPSEAIEWSLKWIKADKVWAMGYKGKGMVVGGIDTGIEYLHPGINQKYRGKTSSGYNHNYNWWDGERQISPRDYPWDDSGHGTHTVGTVVGGNSSYIFGVAPESQFIGCKALLNGRNSYERNLQCCQFMAAPTDLKGQNPDPKLRPHSTINSYQCSTCSQNQLKKPFEVLKEVGVLMAVAAGNAGPRCGSVTQPGYFESVLTIGALQKENDSIAYFSGRGPEITEKRMKPEICAPGVDVVSAYPPDKYSKMSGTSMATPHMAGVILLIWNAAPKLEREIDKTWEILRKTALKKNTDECGSTSDKNHVYGWGNVDVYEAVKLAKTLYPN